MNSICFSELIESCAQWQHRSTIFNSFLYKVRL